MTALELWRHRAANSMPLIGLIVSVNCGDSGIVPVAGAVEPPQAAAPAPEPEPRPDLTRLFRPAARSAVTGCNFQVGGNGERVSLAEPRPELSARTRRDGLSG